jgi:peptidoglycan/LPS O-acetylase OafA/YrhL
MIKNYDKDFYSIMKGYAIICIALHNLLHLKELTGFVMENENSFDVQNTYDFFNAIKSLNVSIIGQIFSFLGWVGVPVFLFISGLGLMKKYQNQVDLDVKKYVIYSWKKLFLLMLPAEIFLILFTLCSGKLHLSLILKSLLKLSLLNNFIITIIEILPGIFWYFGLIFQLYVLFLIFRKMKNSQLIILMIVFLLLQLITVPGWLIKNNNVWRTLRYNFTGWGHIFILGMIVGKMNDIKFCPEKMSLKILLLIISFILLPVLNLSYVLWLFFLPFVALYVFILLADIINYNDNIFRKIGLFLGKYSAFIFVTHAVIRRVILSPFFNKYYMPILQKYNIKILGQTFIYIFLFIIGALIYKQIYHFLMNINFLSFTSKKDVA